ncbi:MAG: nickel pincer cofactor biosynthesis protein LarB [Candidatus Saganbacteria bacterium]|nr:nickel pincer cofactor biosynthesis protein LarB [Candidatus Saganbacteria bacterium]
MNHYEELGFAKVDHHRIKRKGFPEVIYCPGKTTKQIVEIAKSINKKKHPVLMTRASVEVYKAVKKALRKATYHKEAKIITISKTIPYTPNPKPCLIITAGTADIPVAEEAAVTAEFLGIKTERLYDVGVAGIHRLTQNLDKLEKAKVIIVVAGMEGALPSVVGGLVEAPVIAVPTSVGYGANFKGLSALLTMMNSCAPGVAVVNIDNGFGAAVMAHAIIR